ncbi:MAG TPA: ABC transporter ATP-binding protein [Burkholderiaceae bacterium]|jgi:branched-chain amino acid transport system ATP-binding protein
MANLFELKNLHACYGKVEAVHGISLSLEAGQIVSMIGPNGAGKSTALNAAMGALPDGAEASGQILFMGQDIMDMPVEERVMLGISLVPERRELFSAMSVQDNLKLGAFPRKRAGAKHFMDQLEVVYAIFPRLKERARQEAATLSGGERQMLALGRALMAKPTLLMLDEPSLGLAPRIVKDIFHIISDLRKTGVATLLVEQNARAALQVSDYGYVIETGEITIHGKASELAHDQRVIDAYLGLARKAA